MSATTTAAPTHRRHTQRDGQHQLKKQRWLARRAFGEAQAPAATPMIGPMLLPLAPSDDSSFDNAAAELVTMTFEGGGGEGDDDDDGGGETAVLVMVGLTNTMVVTPFAARAD